MEEAIMDSAEALVEATTEEEAGEVAGEEEVDSEVVAGDINKRKSQNSWSVTSLHLRNVKIVMHSMEAIADSVDMALAVATTEEEAMVVAGVDEEVDSEVVAGDISKSPS
jgi:Icc-related predicted phosphoesterase